MAVDGPDLKRKTSDAEAPGVSDFEAYCRDAYEPLVRLAFLLTGSVEGAQDAVQDVFLKVQRRWSTIANPDAYVRRAVVNACRSYHRRRRRDRMRRVDSRDATQLGADELFDVLRDLPPRMRSAVILRFYLDLSNDDIAELLGCAPGTVRSLIHRALARLRTVIEP